MAAMRKREAFIREGDGLIVFGAGLIVSLLAVLFYPLAYLGLFLDIVGIILILATWNRIEHKERQYIVYAIVLYILTVVVVLAIIFSLLFGSFITAINQQRANMTSPASNSIIITNATNQLIKQVIPISAWAKIPTAIALMLFPLGFAVKRERYLLYASAAIDIVLGIALYAVIAFGYMQAPTLSYEPGLAPMLNYSSGLLVFSLGTVLFGLAYIWIGSRLRNRKK